MRKLKTFTLVEIIITAAITFFIAGAVLSVFIVGDKIWQIDMGLVDLQQAGRGALLAMTRELRQSDSANVTISANGDRVDFTIPDATDTITYSLSNGRINREYPAGTIRVITSDVSSLNFCCWNGASCDNDCSSSRLLEISLGLEKTVRRAALSFSLKQKVRLRNE